jgi:hypothetical protein
MRRCSCSRKGPNDVRTPASRSRTARGTVLAREHGPKETVGVLDDRFAGGPALGVVAAQEPLARLATARRHTLSKPTSPRDIGSFGLLVSDVAATSTRVYLAKETKGLYVTERLRQARSRKDDGSKTLSGNPSRK